MFLLESLYTWTGTADQHGAQTTVDHARGLKPRVPGLEWKLWVTNVDDGGTTAGGYYLFHSLEEARAFEATTRESLAGNEHATDLRIRLFQVRDDVSAVTGALGTASAG